MRSNSSQTSPIDLQWMAAKSWILYYNPGY